MLRAGRAGGGPGRSASSVAVSCCSRCRRRRRCQRRQLLLAAGRLPEICCPPFFTLQPPPQLPASQWAAGKLEQLVEDAARLLNELTGSSAGEGDTMRPPAMPLTALTHAQVGVCSAAGVAAATEPVRCNA